MTDKDKIKVILEGVSLKMKAQTKSIEQVDRELEALAAVAVNDDILDDIRMKENQLEDMYADRNALWVKYQTLQRKMEML